MFCDRKRKAVSITVKQQFCKTKMKDFNSNVLLQFVSNKFVTPSGDMSS